MFEYKMTLTPEQIDILSGKKGNVFSKMMEALVRYGDSVGATELIPLSNHNKELVLENALYNNKKIHKLLVSLIYKESYKDKYKDFEPEKLDYKTIINNSFDKILLSKKVYVKNYKFELLLNRLNLRNLNSYIYQYKLNDLIDDIDYKDVLAWSEIDKVIYANSVLGARVNRNNEYIELLCSILGYAPKYGCLTDEGRNATCKIIVNTSKLPNPQALACLIAKRNRKDVPYIYNLDDKLNDLKEDERKSYLRNLGATLALNSSIDLFHVDNITLESIEYGESLIVADAKEYVIDDEEINKLVDSFKNTWYSASTVPYACLFSDASITLEKLIELTHKITEALKTNGRKTVIYKTIINASNEVIEKFKQTKEYNDLLGSKVILSSINPLLYLKENKIIKHNIATSSVMLASKSNARYFEEDALLKLISVKK